MSSDVAIKVDNLSKCYHIYDKPHDRLKESLYPRVQRLMGRTPGVYHRDFWALRDVSFELKKGETVGIIGRNGSGKSTLLQLICGTLNPTSGSIDVRGRIAALLELGSGFNTEFTGRENVHLNAALLGLGKEQISQRFDEIVAFADIGDFLDQPVKTYSSGMMVRLAFAVIAHVNADILVIDEALAVGDTFFTQKCMRYIRQFQSDGGTILFVSHDIATVSSICQSAIMLFAGGRQRPIVGPAESTCKQYLNQIYDDPARVEYVERQRFMSARVAATTTVPLHRIFTGATPEINTYVVSEFRRNAESFGKGGATIFDAGFFDEDRTRVSVVIGGQPVRFLVRAKICQRIAYPAVGVMIKDRTGQLIQTDGTDRTFRHHELVFEAGDEVEVSFCFTMPLLLKGAYTINVALAEGLGDDHVQHHWIHDALKIEALSGPVANGTGGLLTSGITIEVVRQAPEIAQ